MFGRKDKKNITDPIKSNRAQYENLEMTVDATISKTKKVEEDFLSVQKALIDKVENNEKNVNEILRLINDERLESSYQGNVFTPNSKIVITDTLDNTLSTCNMFRDLSMVKERDEIKKALANVISTFVEKDMNKKFHDGLSTLEKCGMLDDSKYELHKQMVGRRKAQVNTAVYAVFDFAPMIVSYLNSKLKKKELYSFIIHSYAYINGEMTPMIQRNLQTTLFQAGVIRNNMQDYERVQQDFNNYCDLAINKIPMLNNKTQSSMEPQTVKILAKQIISHCDLTDLDVRERAKEVSSYLLRLSMTDTESILDEAIESQEYLSDVISFSSVSYRYLFFDFINDIQSAAKYSGYDISNDIQKKKEIKRRIPLIKCIVM